MVLTGPCKQKLSSDQEGFTRSALSPVHLPGKAGLTLGTEWGTLGGVE